MPDVSIVIPNYNGISYLEGCLKSIQEQKNIHPEVMVVDNGSTDGSQNYIKKEFPFCKLICLDQNYGFCRAVNEGFQAAESEYVILLNNDTEVKPDFSRKLLDAIRADRGDFPARPACSSIRIRSLRMMREIFSVGWAGHLPEERENRHRSIRRVAGFFHPAQVPRFTGKAWF